MFKAIGRRIGSNNIVDRVSVLADETNSRLSHMVFRPTRSYSRSKLVVGSLTNEFCKVLVRQVNRYGNVQYSSKIQAKMIRGYEIKSPVDCL